MSEKYNVMCTIGGEGRSIFNTIDLTGPESARCDLIDSSYTTVRGELPPNAIVFIRNLDGYEVTFKRQIKKCEIKK